MKQRPLLRPLLRLSRSFSDWIRQKTMNLDLRQVQSVPLNRFRFVSASLTKFCVATGVIAVLALLFSAGHPVIAIWAASMFAAWLFIAGASMASEDRLSADNQAGSEGDADSGEQS
jgi:hypothetical protein